MTLIAPTGTIGLQMDCDTTGIEPDFAIVKFKKLAGGGYFKIVNASVKKALHKLGYDARRCGTLSFTAQARHAFRLPARNTESLSAKGFSQEKLAKVEAQLPKAFDITLCVQQVCAWRGLPARLGFRC